MPHYDGKQYSRQEGLRIAEELLGIMATLIIHETVTIENPTAQCSKGNVLQLTPLEYVTLAIKTVREARLDED